MCARYTPQTHLIVASLSGADIVLPMYIVPHVFLLVRLGFGRLFETELLADFFADDSPEVSHEEHEAISLDIFIASSTALSSSILLDATIGCPATSATLVGESTSLNASTFVSSARSVSSIADIVLTSLGLDKGAFWNEICFPLGFKGATPSSSSQPFTCGVPGMTPCAMFLRIFASMAAKKSRCFFSLRAVSARSDFDASSIGLCH
mmetsp:Transcript_33046/g.48254  ORF Transcript_33046/g.48254 Transcript_33046/m.48254 type:complete len:207 (+) Transcript_33046:1043-1663(+)